MSDPNTQKQHQGSQEDWKKDNPNQQVQQSSQQKSPQSDRDQFTKDQQKKPA